MFMFRFLHPVRPECDVVNDSPKGEDVVLVLLFKSHGDSGIQKFLEDNE